MLKVTLFSGLLTLFRMASVFMIPKVVAIYSGPTVIAMLGQIQSLFNDFNGVVAAPEGNGVVRYPLEYQFLMIQSWDLRPAPLGGKRHLNGHLCF